MDRITRFSLKNASAIVILALVVTLGGLWSATQLNKESMPDVAIPYVVVVTPYPGAAPQDVYDNITDPMEKALNGIAGVKMVRAQSGDSVSMVIAEFGYSQDMEKAETLVNKAVTGVKLPTTAMTPTVSRISFGSEPILRFAVSGNTANAEALRTQVREDVIPALKGVDGVGTAGLESDAPYSIRIQFDDEKLKDKGLTVAGVVQQLQAANLSFPVGAVDLGKTSEPIRVSGTLSSVEDIESFRIAVYPNSNALVGDALKQIGSGMSAMGNGFVALGGGMSQLGQATGQVALQAGLINGIQQVQAQLYSLKFETLPQLQAAVAQVPADSPQYAQLTAQIDQIKNQAIPGLEAAIAGMQTKITASQNELKKASASAGSSKALSGGTKLSSSGSKGSASLNLKVGVVKLSDVATVTYGPADGAVGSRAMAKPAALISVTKTQDANTVLVATKVRQEMAKLAKSLPAGTKVDYVYDASGSINDSIAGMLREGLLGALFAVIVILLFLRNWRATVIATFSIPLSILAAITVLKLTGVTLNIMTLGGLTVAIGRVIDDAIVVIENVFRHLQKGEERTAETIRKATAEVSSAITSSTLTTVAVFVPLGLVSGIIGKVFQPFAITVGVAMLASLLVAVTVVPLLAKWMLLSGKVPAHRDSAAKPGRVMGAYRGLLGWALDHRAIVAGAAVALLVASVALVPLIGTGFIPESKDKYASITVELPQGTKASVVDGTVKEVETILGENQAVTFYQATIGASNNSVGMSGALGGNNKASMFVRFDEKADMAATVAALRTKVAPLEKDGTKVTISPVSAAGSNSGALELVVKGPDMAAIRAASDAVVANVKDVDGIENVSSNLGVSRSQLLVEVDEAKAAKKGLNAGLIAGTVHGLLADQTAGSIKIDGQATDVTYSSSLTDKDRASKLRTLVLTNPLGKSVKLTDVATVEETASAVAVLTRDGNQYASVTGHITARDSGSVITAVKAKLAELKLPAGVTVEVAGTAEMMSESFSQLGVAMVVAIMAVYLVMIIAFGEAAAPLAIMMSLPLAVVGGLVGLFIAHVPLDMPAMIGALMLIGIVVTNAIVLVDRVRTNIEHKGMSRREALIEAGTTRMRPILMTAVATIIALVPLASGAAEGALISQSLAVIVIGGLTTSTLLTLVIVPVAYDAIEGAKDRILGRRKKVAVVEAEVAEG